MAGCIFLGMENSARQMNAKPSAMHIEIMNERKGGQNMAPGATGEGLGWLQCFFEPGIDTPSFAAPSKAILFDVPDGPAVLETSLGLVQKSPSYFDEDPAG
nr:uncharacterized protein CTRU02_00078 [Colletotrichum truncatum]KAF6801329.1 hypothetical protein CTRU02_00078 [Colletotrichum truncatum]